MSFIATPVTANNLCKDAQALKARGFRFVTMTCVETGPGEFDLIYHFDKDLDMVHWRLAATDREASPSLSTVYLAAFLAENEIQDQFGLRFADLAIDYQGKLYLDEEAGATPFCRFSRASITQTDSGGDTEGGQ